MRSAPLRLLPRKPLAVLLQNLTLARFAIRGYRDRVAEFAHQLGLCSVGLSHRGHAI